MNKYNNSTNDITIGFSIILGAVLGSGLGYMIKDSMIEKNYRDNAIIIYDNNAYKVSELYQLTSKQERHICTLEDDIYYDIQSGNITSVKNHEKDLGYDVINLAKYFPYEEYGIDKIGIQEQFENILEDKPKTYQKK